MANAAIDQQQLNLAVNGSIRQRLQQHAKRVGTTDGSNKELLREWIRGIDHASTYTAAGQHLVLEMVGYLTTGSLASFVQHTVTTLDAAQRTWPVVRDRIRTNYLGEEESEILREKVDALKQSPFEDVRDYARRFRESINSAYDDNQLAPGLILTSLIKNFVNGLVDKQLRSHVFLQRPDTIDNAITHATQGARALGLADITTPPPLLEVAALPAPVEDPTHKAIVELNHIVKSLQKEVKALHKPASTQAVSGEQAAQDPAQPVLYTRRWVTPRGNANTRVNRGGRGGRGGYRTAVCWTCGNEGHISRTCPVSPRTRSTAEMAMLEEEEAQEYALYQEYYPTT